MIDTTKSIDSLRFEQRHLSLSLSAWPTDITSLPRSERDSIERASKLARRLLTLENVELTSETFQGTSPWAPDYLAYSYLFARDAEWNAILARELNLRSRNFADHNFRRARSREIFARGYIVVANNSENTTHRPERRTHARAEIGLSSEEAERGKRREALLAGAARRCAYNFGKEGEEGGSIRCPRKYRVNAIITVGQIDKRERGDRGRRKRKRLILSGSALA